MSEYAPAIPAASTDRRRAPALDGIRGLAILAVVIHNLAYFDGPADSLLTKLTRVAAGGGWVGVQLFFVLSGFLITGILLDTRTDPHRFRSFYVRRVLRIFPLYYLTLLGAFLLVPHLVDLGAWAERARHVQVWYWTYLMNWAGAYASGLPGLSHLWSLAIEEQFYLVWPLVVFGLSVRGLARVCLALIVSALVIRITLVTSGMAPETIYVLTASRWDALGWGAALALAMRDDGLKKRLVPALRRVVLPVGIALAAIVLVDRGLSPWSPLGQIAGYSLVACFFAWLVLAAIEGPAGQGVRRITESRWLGFFGKYSYGLYVLHWPIHQLGLATFSPWVVGGTAASRPFQLLVYVAGGLLVSTAAAVAVFHVLEQPFLSLKDRLAPRAVAQPK